MTRHSITTAVACALVAGSTAFAALPATAATPVARVSYGDLDLGSAAGRHTLARRVSSAASAVCPTEIGDFRAQQDCRRTAFDQAHDALRKAGVTSF